MKLAGNTILITGGSTGIGLALAERLLALGNEVIICGRRAEALAAAKAAHPRLHTLQSDVGNDADRAALFAAVTRDFPSTNVLFNNAGVQRYPKLYEPSQWSAVQNEIAINIEAPIHLTMLFGEHLAKQVNAAVLITTSGLAHVPLAHAPVYSATKAAMHSYALTLRHQMQARGIEVIEVCPPMVDTDLGIPNTHTAGMKLDAYADSVIAGLQAGEVEITVGFSTKGAQASRAERDQIFKQMNR